MRKNFTPKARPAHKRSLLAKMRICAYGDKGNFCNKCLTFQVETHQSLSVTASLASPREALYTVADILPADRGGWSGRGTVENSRLYISLFHHCVVPLPRSFALLTTGTVFGKHAYGGPPFPRRRAALVSTKRASALGTANSRRLLFPRKYGRTCAGTHFSLRGRLIICCLSNLPALTAKCPQIVVLQQHTKPSLDDAREGGPPQDGG